MTFSHKASESHYLSRELFVTIRTGIFALAVSLIMYGAPTVAWSHAFPERSEPRVGAVITTSPSQVRIWFDSPLEPAFSSIAVHDAEGRQVDRKDSKVSSVDLNLLEVSLQPLSPGQYKVLWIVVPKNGHRSTGDFSFIVK
jgi:methionine-rich copper-binding protein CopC